ncbi:Major Facilitator Superfamily protein [Nocardia amikacinitolerans]|uniref:Major Facilitator Superfamily protein n=1 Tax=Nocardia amikacinitolerans TaxID=756689 RepID=A0A285LYT8_9NOCA|nr:MFS transporter [Nocardia amikacinitolerans]MCP2297286.1 Major Facilitator Superfamily protein [Nocardia amikacinitolerans]MCP2317048.1 Major Facilitator Superfamily protein [Nocardia amikacinitolerans]SNY88481.1 Major Facilitator Superfamily protein [Nocardia amikacinitolerans]
MATVTEIRAARRWSMLALGVFAQASSAVFIHGTPFLLPALTARGMSLPTAGLLVAMPTVGLVCTLIAWGYVVDRIGERKVLVGGPLVMFVAGAAAAVTTNDITLGALLFLGGAGAASTNGASGRVIVGWFPPERRGLAMGIRQTAQPLGVGVGALAVPAVAAAHGISTAILVPAIMAGVAAAACYLGIIDPPRPEGKGVDRANPYRGDATLWRIHAVSVLLCVPQGVVWTFALLWLHRDIGWSLPAAGALVTVTQILGAFGRIGAGAWSDRVGSRLGPLRTVAVAAVLSMAALGLTAWTQWWWAAIPLLIVASVITVSDNGLAFTAVAEIAGPYWSGRGLGIQNTGQNLAIAAIPPVFGALITVGGFPAAYLAAAALATAAIPLVPTDSRNPR